MGVSGGGAGGGRAARALRFLFLLVMALAAVEYLCGSIFEASPLRTYIYSPLYDATQPTIRSKKKSIQIWPNTINITISSPEENPPIVSVVPLPKNVSEKKEIHAINTTTSIPVSTTVGKENSTLITRIVDSVKTTVSSTEASNVTINSTHYCELPSDLGPRDVDKTEVDLKSIENKYPEVSLGGWYKPPNCTAKHKVAIIIPYRDRPRHLAIFLNNIHPFLMRQQIDYGIFVIEQQDKKATSGNFNRAKLFNVGFVEANRAREGGWQCFIFHDVDLLPLDERNLYTCPRQPRHMSASIDKHKFKLMYETLFGGVSAMTYEQFTKVNGFSNKYWGWGGEDDDMSHRIRKMNYHIARYKMSIARYTMLDHQSQTANPKRYKLLSQVDKNFKNDGLSSLQYELIALAKHKLFTLVSVNIEENS